MIINFTLHAWGSRWVQNRNSSTRRPVLCDSIFRTTRQHLTMVTVRGDRQRSSPDEN